MGLKAVQGNGALRAHWSQQAATGQAGPPRPRSRGALPAVAGESQSTPAYPLSHRLSIIRPVPGSVVAANRDTCLSPGSHKRGASRIHENVARIVSEHLQSFSSGSAGLSPPHAPLPTLREKQDEGEFTAQSSEGWEPSSHCQPQAAPSSLPSPHLTKSH